MGEEATGESGELSVTRYELYRGYEIEARDYKEGRDRYVTYASPTKELMGEHFPCAVEGKFFLPTIADPNLGIPSMKWVVDKIIGHPEVRNLTLHEWDKFLGYA